MTHQGPPMLSDTLISAWSREMPSRTPPTAAELHAFFQGPAAEITMEFVEARTAEAAQQFAGLLNRETLLDIKAIWTAVRESQVDPPAALEDNRKRIGYAAGVHATREAIANMIKDYGEHLQKNPKVIHSHKKPVQGASKKSGGGIIVPDSYGG